MTKIRKETYCCPKCILLNSEYGNLEQIIFIPNKQYKDELENSL